MPVTLPVQDTRLPVPAAPNYEIDEHGFVYRKGKRLQLQRRCSRWFAQVYDDDGKLHSFDSEKLAQKLFNPEPPTLTLKDIFGTLNAKAVPDWPRYAVTNYGAVYCVDPPKRGLNAGRHYLVKSFLKAGIPYMSLYDYTGERRSIKAKEITRMAWGY